MSDLGRCTSGRRVVRKNTPPGLARDNFPEPIQYPPYGPMPGEVAFFQDAHDAIDYVSMADRIQAVRDLHKPVNVEPSCTFCAECSSCLPNGHYMLTVQYPCPTIRALDGGQ